MSSTNPYILIPNKKIQQLTKKSKLEEITAYALIRNEVKDDKLQASISENELASTFGVTERTVNTYVKHLKDAGLFIEVNKKMGNGDHRYNVYVLEDPREGFSAISKDLLQDPNLSPTDIGLLILLKTHCLPGTNYLPFSSYSKLGELLKIDRVRLKSLIERLSDHLEINKDSIIITNPDILISIKDTDLNKIYDIICEFCREKGVQPPLRNKGQKNNQHLLLCHYGHEEQFISLLHSRFKDLPPKPTFAYFAKGLCGKVAVKQEITSPTILL